MNRSKVEYCDFQWNPITGCLKGCDYCITRKKSKRFTGDARHNMKRKRHKRIGDLLVLDEKFVSPNGGVLNYPFGFAPTYHKYRLNNLNTLKSTMNILVCGDGEMFGPWVPDDVIVEIFDACAAFSQHHYLFLTQYPQRYEDLMKKGLLRDGDSFWYGYTLTENQREVPDIPGYHTFVSFEPMIDPVAVPKAAEWVIIGAETGGRKDKTYPLFEWVRKVVVSCDYNFQVPVFIMESMCDIVPRESMRKDVPKTLKERQLGAALRKKLEDICMNCGDLHRKNEMITLSARSCRGEQAKQFGFMCPDCFRELCEKGGVDIPDLINLRTKDEG